MSIRKYRKHEDASSLPEPIAGNGLLHRRALLGRGIMLASAAATGAGSSMTGAAAEPLTNGPWSLAPGVSIPPYGQPSKFEQKVTPSSSLAAARRARRIISSTAPSRPMACIS